MACCGVGVSGATGRGRNVHEIPLSCTRWLNSRTPCSAHPIGCECCTPCQASLRTVRRSSGVGADEAEKVNWDGSASAVAAARAGERANQERILTASILSSSQRESENESRTARCVG